MVSRIVDACGGSVRDKVIAILGVAFKPNTDDLRDAPSLAIIPALQRAGAKIRAHDPQAMGAGMTTFEGVAWCDGPYHAVEDADGVVVLTEWEEYRALDLIRMRQLMRGRSLIDLRNLFDRGEAIAAEFDHVGIGIGGVVQTAVREAAE